MKLNSKLWMLAVAMATVGCQDDLGNDPNTGGSTAPEGPTTYVKVSVTSAAETTTKAPQNDPNDKPAGGENGDKPGGEVGSPTETKVNDVTVILYKNESSTDYQFKSTSTLVGAGWAAVTGETTGPGDDDWHERQASVEVTITDNEEESFDGKTYGIITVTNLGGRTVLSDKINAKDGISTPQALADFLIAHDDYTNSSNGFVMSSHKPAGESVTLRAGSSSSDAPIANVHVERVAAKVRINEDATNGEDFIYTVKDDDQAQTVIGKARLEEVALVNQLTSGSYLLKRVTSEYVTDYPLASIPSSTNDVYLGDEDYTSDKNAKYVIEPWTRAKDLTQYSGMNGAGTGTVSTTPLSYANQFLVEDATASVGETVAYETLAARWNAMTGTTTLTGVTGSEDLGYVMENTVAAANAYNAYVTGALFKATYFPKQYSAITTKTVSTPEGGQETKQVVAPIDIENDPDVKDYAFDKISSSSTCPTFYVVGSTDDPKNIYKDYKSIWAKHCWDVLTKDEIEKIDYNDFIGTAFDNIKVKDFMASSLATKWGDDFGYVDYLKGVAEKQKGESKEYPDAAFTEGTLSFDEFVDDETYKAAFSNTIVEYTKGVCYYPYWIRHANNNNPTVMGIMEFDIVRNNIYDMTVKGISGLGLAGSERPVPEPVESKDLKIAVMIFVKDWVVRSNAGIIL